MATAATATGRLTLKNMIRHFLSNVSSCDAFDSSQQPTLLEAAEAELDKNKRKIRTPQNFDNMKQVPSQASVASYDGLRIAVQKQINLNSVVSHFYWLGSQATGQPIYQYRIIFSDEDKFLNMSTDPDINVEGEVKWPLFENTLGKLNFTLADQAKVGTAEIHYTAQTWTGHIALGRSPGWVAGCSYIQAITPAIVLGGSAKWDITKDSFSPSFVGTYDEGENLLAAKYDSSFQILYLRRVNPNRVNLSTDLVLGEDLSTTMSLNAEYILKQSKVNFSIDSNLLIKSLLETTLTPGTTLQLSAEVMPAKDHYRFGYGITMGGN